MKYQVGDRVLLLHSNEEGEVVGIINDKMVMVDVEGVQFPVYTDQIDFPYFKRFSEQHAAEKNQARKPHKIYIDNVKKEKPTAKYKVSDGVWLAFLPVYDKNVLDDDVIENFKLYLINQTEEAYHFTYRADKNNFELQNEILALSDFYLHDVAFEEMNDAPKFEFELSLVNVNKKKVPYLEQTLKIKAKILFKKIEEMHVKNEPTFSFLLFEKYPDKMEEIIPDYNARSKIFYDASAVQQKLEPAQSVIDLHIEKLTDNWKHLSNFEILTLQLSVFEKYYQLALVHFLPNLTVIHGIGKGKLKEEIHEILKNKKEVKSFVNQYHPNFGYGATEIFFQY